MKKQTRTQFTMFLVITVSALSCVTSSKERSNQTHIDRFDAITIGASASKVRQIWGDSVENVERFEKLEYRILQYSDESGAPLAMFTLDPQSQLVVGKAKWVSSKDKQSKLDYVLQNEFTGLTFKKYIPCETRTPQDEVLINRDKGLFLFRRMENLLLISWADPKLTDLRVDQFYKKCPKLQTEKR